MICKACGKENFPFRDSHISGELFGSRLGSSLTVTEYCQHCGARIMEKCPVCFHLHPLGVEYCTETGKSIPEALQEKAERERQRAKEETYRKLRFKLNKEIRKQKILLRGPIAILLIAIFVGASIYLASMKDGVGFLHVAVTGIIVGMILAAIVFQAIDWFIVGKPAKKKADKQITILYPEQV